MADIWDDERIGHYDDRTGDYSPPLRAPDALGACGCTDYHMSDCPTRTGGY